jgi:hypothetical protein
VNFAQVKSHKNPLILSLKQKIMLLNISRKHNIRKRRFMPNLSPQNNMKDTYWFRVDKIQNLMSRMFPHIVYST